MRHFGLHVTERERERERGREKNSSENAHADASSGGLRKEIACFTRFTGAFLQARGKGSDYSDRCSNKHAPPGPRPCPPPACAPGPQQKLLIEGFCRSLFFSFSAQRETFFANMASIYAFRQLEPSKPGRWTHSKARRKLQQHQTCGIFLVPLKGEALTTHLEPHGTRQMPKAAKGHRSGCLNTQTCITTSSWLPATVRHLGATLPRCTHRILRLKILSAILFSKRRRGTATS